MDQGLRFTLKDIRSFSGKPHEDAKLWLEKFDKVARLNGWDDDTCQQVAELKLEAIAAAPTSETPRRITRLDSAFSRELFEWVLLTVAPELSHLPPRTL